MAEIVGLIIVAIIVVFVVMMIFAGLVAAVMLCLGVVMLPIAAIRTLRGLDQ